MTQYNDRSARKAAKKYETRSDMGWDEIARAAEEAGDHELCDYIWENFAWGN